MSGCGAVAVWTTGAANDRSTGGVWTQSSPGPHDVQLLDGRHQPRAVGAHPGQHVDRVRGIVADELVGAADQNGPAARLAGVPERERDLLLLLARLGQVFGD